MCHHVASYKVECDVIQAKDLEGKCSQSVFSRVRGTRRHRDMASSSAIQLHEEERGGIALLALM